MLPELCKSFWGSSRMDRNKGGKIMEDFYKTNADFKEYVDKYAKKNCITPEEALNHASVRDAYDYYRDEAKNNENRIN